MVMKFETPAGANPTDRMRVIGRAHDRIDGPAKTTGTAPYAYERHDLIKDPAYGHVIGAAIAKGRITAIDLDAAQRAPGVIAIVTHQNAGKIAVGNLNTAKLIGGPEIQHYHQAVAVVVAETFEQARAAAALVRIDYDRAPGRYDLAAGMDAATMPKGEDNKDKTVGDFDAAFASAPVKIDQRYTTPDHSHAMMEPHATTALWDGDKLTLYTANQMIAWCTKDMAKTLGIPAENVRLVSTYVGGGFGGKLFLRSDALMAALGARAAKRPVKVALARPMSINNTTHRPATIQRIRLGAGRDGRITAIAHESWSGDLPGGQPEVATQQTPLLYAGDNRIAKMRLAELDLPEGNAMRAPGEAPGLMALEVAMDELAEALNMDPVELRILNDTQTVPGQPEKKFSQRQLVECLRQGAERFGWSRRNPKPGQVRDGQWLVGMGVASGFRGNLVQASGARIKLAGDGTVTVETDMTDIGTGSYTIIAQTAAELLGVPMERVSVKLGDSAFPASSGSGGQWGANSATAGVYAAGMKMRETIATKLGLDPKVADFTDGFVRVGNRSLPITDAARDGTLSVEDRIEFGDLTDKYAQATFAGHFVEAAVNAYTGQVKIRRMLAVCAAGRILNPKSARSQVIGGMTMGAGAALMEDLAVDKRFGFFVNHDLAGYEVPVHADIPHQEVVFLDETDAMSSPMKAKGVGELGICGIGAAVANAVYNATGVRVRDYPITTEKHLDRLPAVA